MKIEMTISPDYVPDWGVNEGIREIMQNAVDADKEGHSINYSYEKDLGCLSISSKGASLERCSLLLGHTSKSDNRDQIGQFGEGYKLGCLALIRAGKEIVIHNGLKSEKWSPTIDMSEVFKKNVLQFNIEDADKKDMLEFQIFGVSPLEWEDAKKQFLFCTTKPFVTLSTPIGNIITSEGFKGRIFVGGMFVAQYDFDYGYNINPSEISINRDRRMVDSWNLSDCTSKMWSFIAADRPGEFTKELEGMVAKDRPDIIHYSYGGGFSGRSEEDSVLRNELVRRFIEKHGEDAYPVTCEEDSAKATKLGRRPVMASTTHRDIISESLGSLKNLEEKFDTEYEENSNDVNADNLEFVIKTMRPLLERFPPKIKITAAKFRNPEINGKVKNDEIIINSSKFKNREDALSSFVYLFSELTRVENEKFWDVLNRVWSELYFSMYNDLELNSKIEE